MEFFPAFLRLTHKPVLVVGGGEVACRKVDLLLAANAAVTVVSPDLHSYLNSLLNAGKIEHISKPFHPDDIHGYVQVWATTDSTELNHLVADTAREKGIWTNVVDDPLYCDFITPSMVDRSPLQVAISSGGAAPVLVRFLREKIETLLPQNLGLIGEFAGSKRDYLKQKFATVDDRRKFWERFLRHPQLDNVRNEEELNQLFDSTLQQSEQSAGAIYVVHHGHDVELLSLKALRYMQQSELVLHAGAPFDFINLCRRDAEREQLDSIEAVIHEAQHHAAAGVRVCILHAKPLEKSAFTAHTAIEWLSSVDAQS
uniref:siroheme synthase n=1 Tax=Thaumasiovibrio occultus TaxID=1891184 RepID=UPI000B358646|nr:NAD(P)-dependent oxidoreductase [Thaumasiovibrio occultus]